MNGQAIIELEPPDYIEGAFRIDKTAGLVRHGDIRKETLLYSIYDLESCESEGLGLFDKYGDRLSITIWAMANSCADSEFWTATEVVYNEELENLKKSYRVAVEPDTWGRYFTFGSIDDTGRPVILRQGGPVLIGVPRGCDPQMNWQLLGHSPAVHFYALSKRTISGRMAECVYGDPEAYPDIIKELEDSTIALEDSQFEITGFGPDLDALRIVYSPLFTREQVRTILQESYGMPYYVIKLSAEEYDQWLDGHCGFQVDCRKATLLKQITPKKA